MTGFTFGEPLASPNSDKDWYIAGIQSPVVTRVLEEMNPNAFRDPEVRVALVKFANYWYGEIDQNVEWFRDQILSEFPDFFEDFEFWAYCFGSGIKDGMLGGLSVNLGTLFTSGHVFTEIWITKQGQWFPVDTTQMWRMKSLEPGADLRKHAFEIFFLSIVLDHDAYLSASLRSFEDLKARLDSDHGMPYRVWLREQFSQRLELIKKYVAGSNEREDSNITGWSTVIRHWLADRVGFITTEYADVKMEDSPLAVIRVYRKGTWTPIRDGRTPSNAEEARHWIFLFDMVSDDFHGECWWESDFPNNIDMRAFRLLDSAFGIRN